MSGHLCTAVTSSIRPAMLVPNQPCIKHNDHFAVAIIKDGEVIGHVPHVLNKVVLSFEKRDGNVAFCEVTGQRVPLYLPQTTNNML